MNLNKINLLIEFLEDNPSENEIEKYYLNQILISLLRGRSLRHGAELQGICS